MAGRDFNQGSAIDLVSVGNIQYSEITDTGGPELLCLGDGKVGISLFPKWGCKGQRYTPRKTNMTMKKQAFEDVISY